MTIEEKLEGAVLLLLGWAAGTIIHEASHWMTGKAFGLNARFGQCTLMTGSVFIDGGPTVIEMAVIAVAGAAVMIAVGWWLTERPHKNQRMFGLILLCRAWTDLIPVSDLDGAIFAGAAGQAAAWITAIGAIILCGGRILSIIDDK